MSISSSSEPELSLISLAGSGSTSAGQGGYKRKRRWREGWGVGAIVRGKRLFQIFPFKGGDYSREAIYRGTAVIRGNTVNGGMILVRWVNETIHCTVNDQINARIVYLILRIQAGAYKRSTEANKLLANIHY